MFSNIKSLLPALFAKSHFIDQMTITNYSKIRNRKSKFEIFRAGRTILNNFYF